VTFSTLHPRPGVGILFNPSLEGFINQSSKSLDYLAVIPDRAWIDHGVGSHHRFERLPLPAAHLEAVARELPIVLHSIGLSIGTAGDFDEEYVQNLIEWAERFNSPWISEHLSFSRLGHGHEVNAGVALPIPYDQEVLDLLVPRVRTITRALHCPFLLENSVYYFNYPDQTYSEEDFLNELVRLSGCEVLLDLHNLYTNATNHHFDALEYLNALDLNNVREIHVAGGVPMMGFHTDSHTGPVLEAVWQLLEKTVPRTPNLRGVTFEFHEASYRLLGEDGVHKQIERARSILSSHVPSSFSTSAG
jgi:uncharacterized protein (UPF0276 family)